MDSSVLQGNEEIRWMVTGNFDSQGPASLAEFRSIELADGCFCSDVEGGTGLVQVYNWTDVHREAMHKRGFACAVKMAHWKVGTKTVHMTFMGPLTEEMVQHLVKSIEKQGLQNQCMFYVMPRTSIA